MANDQQQLWNTLHQKNKAELNEPTDFAKEVQRMFSSKVKILELGCGSGSDSYFFALQGNSVIATDFSEIAIKKNKSKHTMSQLEFQVMDISKKMQFSDKKFDLVYSRLSLHYFTDKVTKSIFKEIHRVLKPSGYLCFVCKSTKDPLYGKGEKIEKDLFENEGHIRHYFSDEYVRECLAGLFGITKLTSGKEHFYGSLSAFIKVIAQKK